MPGPKYEDKDPRIDYTSVAEKLFSNEQKVVPFLGAGASAPALSTDSKPLSKPEQRVIEKAVTELGIDGLAEQFFEIAVRVAARMHEVSKQAAQPAPLPAAGAPQVAPAPVAPPPSARVAQPAPTAFELAEALAQRLRYTEFRRAAERLLSMLPKDAGPQLEDLAEILRLASAISNVASSAPSLLSIASYFSYDKGTKELAEFLQKRFAGVDASTNTHKLIAQAAKYYLDLARPGDKDYIIVTTNYDSLMEAELSASAVPHCIVTVSKKDPILVKVRFDPSAGDVQRLQQRNPPEPPEKFYLYKANPLAILFKMHGTVGTVEEGQETAIVSDEDYIAYLERNGQTRKMVPGYINSSIGDTPFLFLGYSFSDWNVRSIYHSFLRDRPANADSPDYAVIREVNLFENAFFRQRTVDLLVTTLDKFEQGVVTAAKNARII